MIADMYAITDGDSDYIGRSRANKELGNNESKSKQRGINPLVVKQAKVERLAKWHGIWRKLIYLFIPDWSKYQGTQFAE